jgi:hypothetical protein
MMHEEVRPIHAKGSKALAFVAAVLTVLTFAAGASSAGLTYRTDNQAAHWLEHNLKVWHGIDLARQDFRSAFCINGYYSKREQHTGKHFPQGKENRAGEDLFHSFSCSLTAGSRTFHLYLVAKRRGYSVRADR